MRFISALLSIPAAILEAMFVPRISYAWHDTREDRGEAPARIRTWTARAVGRLFQRQQPMIFVRVSSSGADRPHSSVTAWLAPRAAGFSATSQRKRRNRSG